MNDVKADFYDVAKPKIEALAVELEDIGLTPGQIVTALIATGTGMGAALIDPAHLAEYLRLLAGKVQRGEYAPPSEPIN